MKYLLVELTNTYTDTHGKQHEIAGALSGQCYIETDESNPPSFMRFVDLDGNTIEIPEVQESKVTDKKPPRLEWMK